MTASEFAFKYKIRNIDRDIIIKLYGEQEKEESVWTSLLDGKIQFVSQPKNIEEIEVVGSTEINADKKAKIESIKRKNESKK